MTHTKKGQIRKVSYIGKGLQREKITRRRDAHGKETHTRKNYIGKKLLKKGTAQGGDYMGRGIRLLRNESIR